MYEIGQKLKIFRLGIGTFTIEVIEVKLYNYIYAKDYKGGYYTYENEWEWYGPKGESYYTLDENNKIKHPQYKHIFENNTETIINSSGWNHDLSFLKDKKP